jgi:hypothetical protein
MKSMRALLCLGLLLLAPPLAAGQTDEGPAFSLWTSQIFTTRERPAFSLSFRQVDHLDFRVYRVEDTLAFFAGLKDPHRLGSEKPMVPQERTWLERIADWKTERRNDLRDFVRRQFSYQYRTQRREQGEKQTVALRQTLQYNTFAQVPLLNPSRLVASWREILPPVKEAESRRIPLEVKDPGVYVVEALSPPLRAYTIVLISDLGLVTKTSPGQLLAYVANRYSGEPETGCDVRALVDRAVAGGGTTSSDGTAVIALAAGHPESVVTVAR